MSVLVRITDKGELLAFFRELIGRGAYLQVRHDFEAYRDGEAFGQRLDCVASEALAVFLRRFGRPVRAGSDSERRAAEAVMSALETIYCLDVEPEFALRVVQVVRAELVGEG